MVIVSFGHSWTELIWDLSHVIHRAILLITLLILLVDWNKFSLDNFIEKGSAFYELELKTKI